MVNQLHNLPGALREEFDRTFAQPPPRWEKVEYSLLLVELQNGSLVALNLRRLAHLLVDRTIVPLPNAPPALLGLAGAHGQVVPVWDLQTLLQSPAAFHQKPGAQKLRQKISRPDSQLHQPASGSPQSDGQLAHPQMSRWIAQTQGAEPIGLGFARLIRQVDLPSRELFLDEDRRNLWKATIQLDGSSVGVLDIPRLLSRLPGFIS